MKLLVVLNSLLIVSSLPLRQRTILEEKLLVETMGLYKCSMKIDETFQVYWTFHTLSLFSPDQICRWLFWEGLGAGGLL